MRFELWTRPFVMMVIREHEEVGAQLALLKSRNLEEIFKKFICITDEATSRRRSRNEEITSPCITKGEIVFSRYKRPQEDWLEDKPPGKMYERCFCCGRQNI
ncbi:hypothetical protein NPIL_109681 [Nephila pilipes]|uniref:Uncharacterized protein n=1 Tax=Nephila pilipes TaxID=299642 RepID=A0A8X6T7G8_NEPPI|nr:hypothetical protein NPIL_109681 [Nephila pilipes]